MSRPHSTATVMACSGAILLLGWGGYLAASRQIRSTVEAETRRQNEVANSLRARTRTLREELAALEAAASDRSVQEAAAAEPEYMPRLRALTQLVAKVNAGAAGGRAILPNLMVDGSAGDEIQQLLGLAPAEVATLETATIQLVSEVAQLALAHTLVERRDRQVVINIDAFAYARRMKELSDAMQDRYMKVLGRERYDAFVGLGYFSAATKELENFGYGASAVQVILTRQPDPAPGEPSRTTPPRYQMQKRITNLAGRTSSSGQTGDLKSIRDTLGLMSWLVPADF